MCKMTSSQSFGISEEQDKSQESTLKVKWKQCLELIKQEVPQQTFQTWFLPIIPVSFVDNQLILRVPSRFFFEWIDSHYGRLLNKAVKKNFGRTAQIEYLIAPSAQEPLTGSETEELAEKKEIESEKIGDLPPSEELPEVDPAYRLDNFFAGRENKLARKAAEYIVANLGKAPYNPLVIYGRSGTGKTHLLHAIGNAVLELKSRKKLGIYSSEHFLHEYIYTLQKGNVNEFKRRLTRLDVFLLDDVHFLSSKLKSQEILLYILMQLVKKKKQIVITSNLAPSRLDAFNPNLISFLQKGLIVDLVPPEYSSRKELILHFLHENEVELPEEVIEFLIENLVDNTHLLKAALTRIVAQISLLGKPIGFNDVQFIVAQLYPRWKGLNGLGNHQSIQMDEIIGAVARFFNIPVDVMIGNSRKKEITLARNIAIYLCREITPESLATIGYHFGDRSHSAVHHAHKQIQVAIKHNPILQNSIHQIKEQILK